MSEKEKGGPPQVEVVIGNRLEKGAFGGAMRCHKIAIFDNIVVCCKVSDTRMYIAFHFKRNNVSENAFSFFSSSQK